MLVIKSNGAEAPYDPERLRKSIELAFRTAGIDTNGYVNEIAREVESRLVDREKVYTSEIRDMVGLVLKHKLIDDPRLEKVAVAYELYWIYKQVHGEPEDGDPFKWDGFDRDLNRWTYNALKVLEARYLIRDPDTWKFKETPYMLLWRVANAIASVEEPEKKEYYARRFFEILAEGVFLPNSPTLMNAGTANSMLSACFVIPVRDALTTPDGEGILDALRAQAIIQKHGGGTGFSFTELRPKWDPIHTTGGMSSGPLSFMKLFDTMTDVVKQGGKRRGANMGIMEVWHADIRDFIKAKTGELKDVNLQNFNISVMITDDFMYRALAGLDWPLVNPRKTSIDGSRDSREYAYVKARHYFADDWVAEFIMEELEKHGGSIALDETKLVTFDEAMAIAENEGAVVDRVDARALLLEIVEGAWDSGDPGVINLDTLNKRHPVWYLGKVNSVNPCSEAVLRPWEPCNLGSIDLAKFVLENGTIDYKRLEETIRLVVRFLDNVIDVNKLPIDKMERANKETRKIGLGVMGWAHLLMKLGIPYASMDALYLAWYLSDFIARVAIHESIMIAKEKGVFPAFDKELYRPLWKTLWFESLEEALEKSLKYASSPEYIDDIEGLIKIGSWRPGRIVITNTRLARESGPSWDEVKAAYEKYGMRNASVLSIAPTGTISILAGTSPGIEPVFALAFIRKVAVGEFVEFDPVFLDWWHNTNAGPREELDAIAERGVMGDRVEKYGHVWRTALEIPYEWHIMHTAIWQNHVDQSISKTINMPHDATKEEVFRAILMAWAMGIKGMTVYRDGSKGQQVINVGLSGGKKRRKGLRLLGKGESLKKVVEGFAVDPSACPTCQV